MLNAATHVRRKSVTIYNLLLLWSAVGAVFCSWHSAGARLAGDLRGPSQNTGPVATRAATRARVARRPRRWSVSSQVLATARRRCRVFTTRLLLIMSRATGVIADHAQYDYQSQTIVTQLFLWPTRFFFPLHPSLYALKTCNSN